NSDEWLTGEKESVFAIETTTLDGAGQSAKGKFQIRSLKQPQEVARPDFTKDFDFRNLFTPDIHNGQPDLSRAEGWEPGDAVLSTDFETKADGKAQYKAKLAPGIYRATLETTDRFGRKVTTQRQFVVVDPSAKTFPVKLPNFVVAPKWSVEVGGEFVLLWG